MPIFNYECTKCKHNKDLIVKYDEREEPRDCAECNSKKTLEFVNKIQKSSFALKGSGWFDSGGY